MGSGRRPDALRVEVPIPVREGTPPGALAAPVTSAQHVKILGGEGREREDCFFGAALYFWQATLLRSRGKPLGHVTNLFNLGGQDQARGSSRGSVVSPGRVWHLLQAKEAGRMQRLRHWKLW